MKGCIQSSQLSQNWCHLPENSWKFLSHVHGWRMLTPMRRNLKVLLIRTDMNFMNCSWTTCGAGSSCCWLRQSCRLWRQTAKMLRGDYGLLKKNRRLCRCCCWSYFWTQTIWTWFQTLILLAVRFLLFKLCCFKKHDCLCFLSLTDPQYFGVSFFWDLSQFAVWFLNSDECRVVGSLLVMSFGVWLMSVVRMSCLQPVRPVALGEVCITVLPIDAGDMWWWRTSEWP